MPPAQCPFCGAPLADDSPNCPKCGATSPYRNDHHSPAKRRKLALLFVALVAFCAFFILWLPRTPVLSGG